MKISLYLHAPLQDGTWTIYLRYAHSRRGKALTPIRISMRESIKPANWNKKKQQAFTRSKNRDVRLNIIELNEKLEAWKARAHRIARQYIKTHGDYPEPQVMKKLLLSGPQNLVVSFWDGWQDFEKNYYPEISANSQRLVGAVKKSLIAFELFRGRGIESAEIDYPFALAFAQFLESTGNNNRTINTKLATLKRVIRYANRLHGFEVISPERLDWKKRKQDKPLRVYLTEREFFQFYRAEMPNDKIELSRDLWILQAELGCRYSELWQLQIYGETASFKSPKTGKDLTLPLSPIAKEILAKHNPLPYLNPSTQRGRVKQAAMAAELNDLVFHNGQPFPKWQKLSTHAARRTWGNIALSRGFELSTIQAWYGHSQLSQTMDYLDMKTRAQDELIRKASK